MWEGKRAVGACVCVCMCVHVANISYYYTAYHSDPLSVPRLTVNTATSISVEYTVERSDTATTRVITGYEVFRFGVPMIGEYVNAHRGRRVTISPAVPGAQYRITAWALDSGTRRSASPAVKSAITGGASEHSLLTPRTFLVP